MEVLVKDYVVFFDKEDFDLFEQFTWLVHKQKSNDIYLYKKTKPHYFHMYIAQRIGLSGFIDHIDGNGLNNMRSNLRSATYSQNAQNTKKRKGTTSQFKGVCRASKNRWKATIELNGKQFYLGLFASETEAAHAYNLKAQELFGEYARLNDL